MARDGMPSKWSFLFHCTSESKEKAYYLWLLKKQRVLEDKEERKEASYQVWH